jgi:predicted RNA-binding protein YlxR (DUF448 family)
VKFTDLLSQFRVAYRKGDTAGWIQLDCPNCGRPYLGFNLGSNYMNCWSCGHLDLVQTVALLIRRPAKECRKLLGDLAKERIKQTDLPGKLVLPKVRSLHRAHRDYLERRGFDPEEIIRLWSILGIGLGGRLAWRIFIPITLGGQVMSWTTRSISDTHPSRYISAGKSEEAVPHKTLLYGEDYCRHAIIVHEGPLDVWATGPGAVATCGTAYSRAQLLRIAKYPTRVICFDNERDAQKRAKKICRELGCFEGSTYNVVLSGKDAASSPKEEIKQLRLRFLGQSI